MPLAGVGTLQDIGHEVLLAGIVETLEDIEHAAGRSR